MSHDINNADCSCNKLPGDHRWCDKCTCPPRSQNSDNRSDGENADPIEEIRQFHASECAYYEKAQPFVTDRGHAHRGTLLAEIGHLRAENERLAAEWQQCHERNSEMCSEHFQLRAQLAERDATIHLLQCGKYGTHHYAQMLSAAREREARLRDALQRIASMDYRGNRSTEMQIAYQALQEPPK